MDENNILAVTLQKVRFAVVSANHMLDWIVHEEWNGEDTAEGPQSCMPHPDLSARRGEAAPRLRWCQSCAASQSQIVLDQSRILWIAPLFEVGFLPEGTMVLRHSQQVLQWDFLVDLIRTNCVCVGRISGYEMWLTLQKQKLGREGMVTARSRTSRSVLFFVRTTNRSFREWAYSLIEALQSIGRENGAISWVEIEWAASRSFYYSLTGTHGTAVRCSAITSPRSEASFIPLCRIGYF